MRVTNEHLDRLEPLEAVEMIEAIIHADARLSGIPASSLSFPHKVNVADMGVDGRGSRGQTRMESWAQSRRD